MGNSLRFSLVFTKMTGLRVKNCLVFPKMSRGVVVSPYSVEGVTENDGVGFRVRSSGFRLRSIAWLQRRTTASSFVLRDVERRKRNPLALGPLDFWNTFAKHDSLFQKSLLLAPRRWPAPWKARQFCVRRVPKDLEFCASTRKFQNSLLLLGNRNANQH